MVRVHMVADDLTGANANCSLMRKIGLNAASILDLSQPVPKKFDVIVSTTDSRALNPKEAYAAVKTATTRLLAEDVSLYSKRVDSTLRGNLGPELKAMLEVLGDDYIAIAVPVYPGSGRIVVNGEMLVNGSLLTNTDAGRDPKTPVDTSVVKELFVRGIELPTKSVFLQEVEMGVEYLKDLVKREYDSGTKLLVFDGVTETHLQTIARAVVASGVKFFAVDPGPFSMEVTDVYLESQKQLKKVLFIVGSVTDITIDQIRELILSYPVNILKVDAGKLAVESLRGEEIERARVEAHELFGGEDLLLITTTPFNPGEKRVDLKAISVETGISIDDISIMISDGLAEIAEKILIGENSFAGAFLSGGDITVALTKKLRAVGIDIQEEVIPLAASGTLIGGDLPGLKVVTKGGMIGGRDAMKLCLEKLRRE